MSSQDRKLQSELGELGTDFSTANEFTPHKLYSGSVTRPGVIGGRGGGNGDAPRERTPAKTPDFNPSWQEGAACTGEDPELFFAEESQTFKTPEQRATAKKAAQAICRDCVIRKDCQDFALSTNQAYGTWDGMDEKERRRYKKRQSYKKQKLREKLDSK